eukprot:11636450-Alexandrium_andersonii.AAC.1
MPAEASVDIKRTRERHRRPADPPIEFLARAKLDSRRAAPEATNNFCAAPRLARRGVARRDGPRAAASQPERGRGNARASARPIAPRAGWPLRPRARRA